jgi:hypothetical protein
MDLSLGLFVLTAAGLVLAYRGWHLASCPGGPRRFTGASGGLFGIGLAAAGLGLGGILFLHGPWGGGGMHRHGMGGMGGRMGGMGGMMAGAPAGPDASVSAADVPEPASPGARLFVRYCAACHALPRPSLHTAPEWPAVVERMRGNMMALGRPVPADAEAHAIADYLGRHARDGAPDPEPAPGP